MSIANVIKQKAKRKKERKERERRMSGADIRKDGTTAESWDWKMANPRIDEPYKEQYRKEMESKQGARRGKSPESKPAKRVKPMEGDKYTRRENSPSLRASGHWSQSDQFPMRQGGWPETATKPSEDKQKQKKTRKKKVVKPKKDNEFEKLYGDWV